jgi:hypothetical protein
MVAICLLLFTSCLYCQNDNLPRKGYFIKIYTDKGLARGNLYQTTDSSIIVEDKITKLNSELLIRNVQLLKIKANKASWKELAIATAGSALFGAVLITKAYSNDHGTRFLGSNMPYGRALLYSSAGLGALGFTVTLAYSFIFKIRIPIHFMPENYRAKRSLLNKYSMY